MKEVTIYTDGACSGNPGPGGWAAILKYGEHVMEISDSSIEDTTTNIRMELTAAIQALSLLKERCRVNLHTDLQLLVDAVMKLWLLSWEKNGWKLSSGKPVQNVELWQMLLKLLERHDVTVIKVKGHSGDPLNERCDDLAKAACQHHIELLKAACHE